MQGFTLYNLNKYIANILNTYVIDENNNTKNSTTLSSYIRNNPNPHLTSFSWIRTLLQLIHQAESRIMLRNICDQLTSKMAIPQNKFLDQLILFLKRPGTFLLFLLTSWWCYHGRTSIFNRTGNLYAGTWTKHMCLEKFFATISNLHQNIKLTMKEVNNGKLVFLDTLLKRNNREISVLLYGKPTHTEQYLHYSS